MPIPRTTRPGLLALVLACGLAAGQDRPAETPPGGEETAAAEKAEGELPPEVPRPEFIENRPLIPDFLLRRKTAGFHLNPIPAIGYDDEEGISIGAIGELFDNGPRDDPFFRTAPYRWKLSLAAVTTTSGTQRYLGHFDHPYLLGTPYRLRGVLGYERNDQANYFGVGDDGNGHLNFPGSPESFRKFSDYEDAIEREVNGTTYARFNEWKSERTQWGVIGERDLFGGIVRPLLGLQFQHLHVGDYTGNSVDAVSASGDDVRATQLPTKLLEDSQAGIIDGIDGGWTNFVKLGISLDTRDFEPDPTSGILAQAMSEIATRYVASDFDYQRVTLSLSGYQDLLPGSGRVIFASRGLYSMQFGNVPFFSLDTLTFADRDREGLGAFQTLRGFKRDRFIGESAVLVNAELRWNITEFQFWNQNLRPILAPFVDAGRAFDGTRLEFEHWHVGYGVGLKLAWNLSTVVSFDYGISEEDKIFYMELGHQF